MDTYRDGRVHVLSERCATCVFRPGNPMSLGRGRLRELVDANLAADSALTCHATLYGQAEHNAVCRGFFDAYGNESSSLRLAQAFGVIEYDNPPMKE